VELLDDGCCGMAGTFGYETEHYELSRKVGELKLLPALRSPAPTEEWIAASTGTACRMQIVQGTGLKACHPIELVSKSLSMIGKES